MALPKNRPAAAKSSGESTGDAVQVNPKPVSPTSPGGAKAKQPARAVPASATSGQENRKEKKVRAAFALTESRLVLLSELKARCLRLGINAKKGEILGAALQVLSKLPESAFEASVAPFLHAKQKAPNGKMRKK
jgi:hypothetical protein